MSSICELKFKFFSRNVVIVETKIQVTSILSNHLNQDLNLMKVSDIKSGSKITLF